MNYLRAVSNWGRVGIRAVFYGAIALTLGRVPGLRSLKKRCMRRWCAGSANALGIRRALVHGHRLDAHPRAILVANHLSFLDVLVLGSFLERDFRWLAKASLFKVPFMGWYLGAAGHIPVYPRAPSSLGNHHIADAIHKAASEGASVLFFPEGTRSSVGELRPFRLGAFTAAVREGLPIIPLVIRGTHEIMEKGSKDLSVRTDRTCTITVLPAIELSAGCDGETVHRACRLRDLVYDTMANELSEPNESVEDMVRRESA